jgi:hypothetical protein
LSASIWAAWSHLFSFAEHPGGLCAQIFPGQDAQAKVNQVLKFLKALPCSKLPLSPATVRCYDGATIEAVEKYGDDFTTAKKAATAMKMQKTVSPKAVLPPALLGAAQIGNTRDWQLADRVICLKDTGTVPFGMRGTVVGFSEDNLMVRHLFAACV